MVRRHWQDWLTLLVGMWLIVSSWVLGIAVPGGTTAQAITWNFVLSGVAALALGIAALASFRVWKEWADVLLGLWLVASPWILGFLSAQAPRWNALACGLIIIVAAASTIYDEQQTGEI